MHVSLIPVVFLEAAAAVQTDRIVPLFRCLDNDPGHPAVAPRLHRMFDQRLSNALAPVLASDTDPDDAAGTPAFRDQRARPHQESLDLGDDEDVAGSDVACGDVVDVRIA